MGLYQLAEIRWSGCGSHLVMHCNGYSTACTTMYCFSSLCFIVDAYVLNVPYDTTRYCVFNVQ